VIDIRAAMLDEPQLLQPHHQQAEFLPLAIMDHSQLAQALLAWRRFLP